MEIFYSDNITGGVLTLTPEESVHCVRVLRHRCGDHIDVVDGQGTLYSCTLLSDRPSGVTARVEGVQNSWNAHPYTLTMAVCPTKNNERFEWFVEKAVEVGVDRIVPLIGQRSERRVYKTGRARKIVLSAAKQSLKAAFPSVEEAIDVMSFVKAAGSPLKLIACCYEDESHPRVGMDEVLRNYIRDAAAAGVENPEITIMIGPEGDFSPEELSAALDCGFVPVHIGASRLRTETAAVVSVSLVYGAFMKV